MGFATQRLLRDEGIRSCSTCVQFIVDHVHEFNHVLDANRDTFGKRFTRSAVIKNRLSVFGNVGFLHEIEDFFVADSVKSRGRDAHMELAAGKAQMDFEDLTDVHTRRNAHRGEKNVNRGAIR